jgi:hypothetical protein
MQNYLTLTTFFGLMVGLILVYARGWLRWPLSLRYRRLVELRKSLKDILINPCA